VRPVNLIPPEDRRGIRAPLRAGSMSYVIVGACAAILVAVLAMVLTQNSITERENEIAELEVKRDAAADRAAALAPYAQFAALQVQRELTISSLAESRFDWERVLRELALVIPANVTLETLEAATAGGSDAASTVAPMSPSLTMTGCAPKHDDVATFVAALEDIDGVTRVGIQTSEKEDEIGEAAASGTANLCGTDAPMFEVMAVFDGVTIELATAPAAPIAPPAPPASGEPEEAAADSESAEEPTGQTQTTSNVVPGTAR